MQACFRNGDNNFFPYLLNIIIGVLRRLNELELNVLLIIRKQTLRE